MSRGKDYGAAIFAACGRHHSADLIIFNNQRVDATIEVDFTSTVNYSLTDGLNDSGQTVRADMRMGIDEDFRAGAMADKD